MKESVTEAPAYLFNIKLYGHGDGQTERISGKNVIYGQTLSKGKESAVLEVGGKESGNVSSCYDFFFGQGRDGNQPWNNGVEFHWQWWSRYSDELWDNLAITQGSAGGEMVARGHLAITQVILRRGGMLLFDSTQTHSMPNKTSIVERMIPSRIETDRERIAVIDLSESMKKFKQLYYELDHNPVLLSAYDDLGQMDSSKYMPISTGWCSEFASYVYRYNGITAPVAKSGEITWRVLKNHYRKHGTIYQLRDIARWTQKNREARIKPGSLVSIVTAHGTAHILLLTQWKQADSNGTFTAISGNNHGMVWHHASLSLPQLVKEEEMSKMSRDSRRRFDERSFVAVPAGLEAVR